jgi:cytochrome b
VWDGPTRLFHWSIVTLVIISWLSVDQGYLRVHLLSGVTLLVLLLFRILWGFFGSTTARFSNFVRPPRVVLSYLRPPANEPRPHYAGHNPAGGLMVLALIGLLLAQVGTGLFANDGLSFTGPLALSISAAMSDLLTKVHGYLFYAILAAVWMHVVAVFFYLSVKRENLIGPMLTGFKRRDKVPAGAGLQFRSGLAAGLMLVVVACLVRVMLF